MTRFESALILMMSDVPVFLLGRPAGKAPGLKPTSKVDSSGSWWVTIWATSLPNFSEVKVSGAHSWRMPHKGKAKCVNSKQVFVCYV